MARSTDVSQVRIRAARPAHVAPIARLEARLFPEHAYTAEQVAAFVASPDCIARVAELPGGALAGHAIGHLLRRRSGLELDIGTLAVRRGWRRRGLARRLLRASMRAARRRGARRATLQVGVENLAAQALYTDQGYRTVRRLRDYHGPGRDALLMARDLS